MEPAAGSLSVMVREGWRWWRVCRCLHHAPVFLPVWPLWWNWQQPHIICICQCAVCMCVCVCVLFACVRVFVSVWSRMCARCLARVSANASSCVMYCRKPLWLQELLRLAWHVAGHMMYYKCSVMDCSKRWWIIDHALCLCSSPFSVCYGGCYGQTTEETQEVSMFVLMCCSASSALLQLHKRLSLVTARW